MIKHPIRIALNEPAFFIYAKTIHLFFILQMIYLSVVVRGCFACRAVFTI